MENHWYRHDEGITNICFEFTKRVNSLILLLTLSNCFNFYNFGFVIKYFGNIYIYIVIQIRVVGYFIYLRLTLWDP